MSRAPYHQTRAGLYRSAVRHPVTGGRVVLSSRSLGELMGRRERWERLRHEYASSMTCGACGAELVAELPRAAIAVELSEIEAGNVRTPGKVKLTLARAWKSYEDASPKEHKKKLRAVWTHEVQPFFPKDLRVGELSEKRVVRWMSALAEEGYAARSIRNAFWMLCACYRRAVAAGLAPTAEPWGRARPPKPQRFKTRLLLRDELSALSRALGGLEAEYGRLVVFCALTGLRNGELAALGWDDLELDRGVMVVRHKSIDEWRKHYPDRTRPTFPTKGRHDHPQKLHPQALAILQLQSVALAKKGHYRLDGPVWPDARGQWRPNACALRNELLARAARRAGLSPKGIHCRALRHAFGSWEVHGGNDVLSASERIGHRNVRTTAETYLHALRLPESRIPPFAVEDLTAD